MKKFFKLLLLVIPLLCYTLWGMAQTAIINEVQPDPGNGEGGIGEFIELYCPPGGGPCNVSCYIIATDDNNIFTIPAGTSIPAGGYLVAYNSAAANTGMTQTSGDYNGWNAAAFGPNVIALDLSTCNCSSSGVAYDNNTGVNSNGSGQRIVMFTSTGALSQAFAYCSQAGADINGSTSACPAGTYNDDPDGCGPLFGSTSSGGICTPAGGGSPAGTQPEGLLYTYGTCNPSFDIPTISGSCPAPASVILPARGNAAYETSNACIVGCSSSIARQTDGSTTWVDDNSPTPGKPNDSAAADVTSTYSSGTCTPVNLPLENYDIRHHENDNFTRSV
ncbi:MAG: lamin tail domain-containing protein, partial [Chitinophagales bacterium]|nr:lamin tail domain-containing protein [Chitinophagales bacterium]